MNRKTLKKEARKNLYKNYWHSVAVVFFISIMIGNFAINSPNININQIPVINSFNSGIAEEFIESITKIKINLSNYQPTRGIFANIFNNITASGSFIFGILNSLNQLIFHDRIWASMIILLGAILTFLYWLFIRNVLFVGQARFFLESKNHKKTSFTRIFMPFRIGKWKSISLAMMRKTLTEWAWWLTIVGGFVKHYAYALVPYILAENPGIKGKRAMNLSENMMKGYKWQLFKLDVSFILWYILDICTFRLFGSLYSTPYKKYCMSEIYIELRNKAKENKIINYEVLNDDYLLEIADYYPKDKFLYKEITKKITINTDYNKNYSITSIILMFFAAAIIGWCWEVFYHMFRFGNFVNRGVLQGPWLPIYGWGLILLLILLKKYRKDPIKTFILAIVVCGIVEYATGWYLETFHNARWWNYDGYFLNIQGRICLENLLAFGIGGCLFIYFLAPFLDSIFIKIKKPIKIIICIILIILYIIDSNYSGDHPNMGKGISRDLPTTKITKDAT